MSELRVAIVGAGPAGFYAADKLLRNEDFEVKVNLIDRLPTPWGLVRAGVAPDHPNIKAVSRVYEKTAALPGFDFYGNVEVGSGVSHAELLDHHHAVIYATGASGDRRLEIPGEDLPGSLSATEFVAWYNGHPDATELEVDLSGKRAVVVGNGNVALDVARMLVLSREEIGVTDTADHAIDVFAESSIEEVVVLGRRGPLQSAFTNPELRELPDLSEADVIVDPADVELDAGSKAALEDATPTAKRNVEILQGYAALEPTDKPKRVELRFLVSPVEILGSERVQGVRLERNRLEPDADGILRARPTGEFEELECDLVLRSVGYRGTVIEGVPFSERAATIVNDRGRVLDGDDGAPVQGVYATGWIKRGPSGVIGTNKKCANETVAHLLEDAEAGRLHQPAASDRTFESLLESRGAVHVDYAGWQRIDEHERAAGESQGRPRVKLTRREELLRSAGRQAPARDD